MVAALHVEGSWVVSGSAEVGVPHLAAGPAGTVGYRCLLSQVVRISQSPGEPLL